MSWAQDEFKTLELGDQRLNARAVLLAERLSSKPTESIPTACPLCQTRRCSESLTHEGQRRIFSGTCIFWMGTRGTFPRKTVL